VKICIINCVSLNGGDAAILFALARTLREAFGEAIQLEVFDSDASVARRYYPSFEFRQMARLPKSGRRTFSARWSLALRLAACGMHAFGRAVAPAALKEHWRAYAEADLVVSTGGTYLVEHYNLEWRFLHLMTVAASRRPLVLFTQTLGPFRSARNRAWLRRLLPSVALLLVRDAASERHIAEAKAARPASACLADAVFALAEEQRLRRARERTLPSAPRVAVSVRDWPHFADGNAAGGMARYRAAIGAGVIHLVRDKRASVTFLSTCQGIPEYRSDDAKVATEVWRALPDDVRARVSVDRAFHTPEALMAELARFDLVLATRMHAAILSLAAGTPVLPVAYEFKTRALFEALGWGDWVLDIESLDGGVLVERLDRLFADLPRLRGGLFEAVERQRRSALQAAALMRTAWGGEARLRSPGPGRIER